MARMTAARLKQMVDELLTIAPIYERYKQLEKEVKGGLVGLKYTEIDVPGKGRVFVTTSERVTVPVELAVDVLGHPLADKVIVVKRYVSNDILKAFVTAGEIDEAQREQLLDRAKKQAVTSLYVRPLQ